MMKAFGSCPPEYRIMAVWIFIFLTLLYMILLICEGTGERKKGDAAGQPVAYSCFLDNVRVMCAAGIL